MKKLFLITLLMAFVVNAQEKWPDDYPLIMGQYANYGGGGNLFDSDNKVIIDVDNKGLFVVGGKVTLTQTGAQVQTILDGTFGSEVSITGGVLTDADYGHIGDPNTQFSFSADRLILTLGGTAFFDFREATQNYIDFNSAGADIDFQVEASGVDSALFIDGASGLAHIEGELVVDGGVNYKVDTASDDDYLIAIASIGGEAIVEGTVVRFAAVTDNTGACTLKINDGPTINIKTQNGGDPVNSYIDQNSFVEVGYDGTNWVLMVPDANP